jgi:hypothetical protein
LYSKSHLSFFRISNVGEHLARKEKISGLLFRVVTGKNKLLKFQIAQKQGFKKNNNLHIRPKTKLSEDTKTTD